MSFQGDVAGIGLGELLQGLARGERNGVLTLTGRHLLATVGLRKGQLYLLPGPEEDDSLWRDRCMRAFDFFVRAGGPRRAHAVSRRSRFWRLPSACAAAASRSPFCHR